MTDFSQHRARAAAATLALCAALGSFPSHALENGAMRFAPGWGGGDLVLPLQTGISGTVGIMHYEADRLRDDNGNTPQIDVAPGVTAKVGTRTRVTAIIPRIAWVSEQTLWGGNIGVGALIPYLQQDRSVSLTGQFSPAVIPAAATDIQTQLNQQAALLGGDNSAWGDLEIAPLLSWSSERWSVVFASAFVLPTGRYDPVSPVNAGAGDYKTFRPTLSAGYAGNGWDAGVRGGVAFNTRNHSTGVKSGSYAVMDGSLLKDLGPLRAGLQGYMLQQFENDEGPGTPAHGNKARAFALGPGVCWTNSDATWVVDAKVLKEFGVRNRTEGRTFWVSISERF